MFGVLALATADIEHLKRVDFPIYPMETRYPMCDECIGRLGQAIIGGTLGGWP